MGIFTELAMLERAERSPRAAEAYLQARKDWLLTLAEQGPKAAGDWPEIVAWLEAQQ
jgi:hypothetical protein